MIKSNPQEIKIDHLWISSFANPTKINKKNIIKIDEEGKIPIKPQLLRSMSTRSDQGEGSSSAKEEMSMDTEMSRMCFEAVRPILDLLTSLEIKVIGYKTRTVSEPNYEDRLVKNMTMKISYEPIQTPIASISQ